MTKFIGVASGKGGVGKTTVAINTAMALNHLGYDVTVLDANLATPHVAMYLGAPIIPITLNNVLKGDNSLAEATYIHQSGLKIIPSSISLDDIDDFNPRRLSNFLFNQNAGDIVVMDLSSGLTGDVAPLLGVLDELIVVVNADMPSITEALKTIKMAEKHKVFVRGIVLNRSSKHDIVSKKEIETIIGSKILSSVPEHLDFKKSMKLTHPIVFAFPESSPACSFKLLAAKLVGADYVVPSNNSLIANIKKFLGL